jgi:ketosteroid isomerase-like protein
MTTTPVASTEAVLGHHLQCFGAGDLDGILADYTPEAVMCTANGVVRGREALTGLFKGLFAEFGKPGASFSMQQQTVEGNVAHIVWSAETADNVYELATDTFVVRNGKIEVQTFAAKVTPKS